MSIAVLITCSSLYAVGTTLVSRMCTPARRRESGRAY
jgi:hypothetical protein